MYYNGKNVLDLTTVSEESHFNNTALAQKPVMICKILLIYVLNCFEFQHGTIHYRGMIPPFWNPFKLLDLNHIIRTIDRMAQEVHAIKK